MKKILLLILILPFIAACEMREPRIPEPENKPPEESVENTETEKMSGEDPEYLDEDSDDDGLSDGDDSEEASNASGNNAEEEASAKDIDHLDTDSDDDGLSDGDDSEEASNASGNDDADNDCNDTSCESLDDDDDGDGISDIDDTEEADDSTKNSENSGHNKIENK